MINNSNSRKPDVYTAMEGLISQIRSEVIDRVDYQKMCVDDCYGCPKKIVEFLIMTVEAWEEKVTRGERVQLGDLNKLSKIAVKSQAALKKNGVL